MGDPVRFGPRAEAAESKPSAFRSAGAPVRALGLPDALAGSTLSFAALNESAFQLLANSGDCAAAAAPAFPLEESVEAGLEEAVDEEESVEDEEEEVSLLPEPESTG